LDFLSCGLWYATGFTIRFVHAVQDLQIDVLNKTQAQVAAAQGGDREALNDLFARYLPRVRRIVASRMGQRLHELFDHEDLIQDALGSAIGGLQRFEHRSEGSFCNWLAQCVENTMRNHARHDAALKRGGGRVKRFADFSDSLAESIFADGKGLPPSGRARAREDEERIEAALLRLNQRYREVINLRVYCEMSYQEIAETMNLTTENTANVLFLRARHQLGKMLS